MALIKCKQCGNDVADNAKACPKCGAPNSAPWYYSSAFLALCFLLFWPLAVVLIWKSPTSRTFTKVLVTVFGLLVGLLMLAGLSGKTSSSAQPVAPAALVQAAAAAAPAAAPQIQDTQALSFGKPTVKTSMGMVTVMVEAKNVSGHDLRSCVVTATFKKGDTILGTANGAVNQIPADATTTAQLMSTDNITGYDALRLEARTCF